MIKPRLTDFYGIHKAQAELRFAIPFFDEDLPLFVDPFLLWKSPSLQDNSLHRLAVDAFNELGRNYMSGNTERSINQLIDASECDEIGLGMSKTMTGKRIGRGQAVDILSLFNEIGFYRDNGFGHIEEIQLLVDGIGKDRISDIFCNFIKSFIIDYTIEECSTIGIPLEKCTIKNLYNPKKQSFESEVVSVPVNPVTNKPLLLVPRHWLRFSPWISFESYFRDYCPKDTDVNAEDPDFKVKILRYNRSNYGLIEEFIKIKEKTFEDCHNDPLFTAIPVLSAKRSFSELVKIPTGKNDNADKRFEKLVGKLLPSLFYPFLDFASEQVRTDSGAHIRDLIFYNNTEHQFFKKVFDDYDSEQIVFELKNVRSVCNDHVDQLNRYLSQSFGRFGVIVTRGQIEKKVKKNLVDLWSGQRKCILILSDNDLEQMVDLFESKQRHPVDVLKKIYVEFKRSCPV